MRKLGIYVLAASATLALPAARAEDGAGTVIDAAGMVVVDGVVDPAVDVVAPEEDGLTDDALPVDDTLVDEGGDVPEGEPEIAVDPVPEGELVDEEFPTVDVIGEDPDAGVWITTVEDGAVEEPVYPDGEAVVDEELPVDEEIAVDEELPVDEEMPVEDDVVLDDGTTVEDGDGLVDEVYEDGEPGDDTIDVDGGWTKDDEVMDGEVTDGDATDGTATDGEVVEDDRVYFGGPVLTVDKDAEVTTTGGEEPPLMYTTTGVETPVRGTGGPGSEVQRGNVGHEDVAEQLPEPEVTADVIDGTSLPSAEPRRRRVH